MPSFSVDSDSLSVQTQEKWDLTGRGKSILEWNNLVLRLHYSRVSKFNRQENGVWEARVCTCAHRFYGFLNSCATYSRCRKYHERFSQKDQEEEHFTKDKTKVLKKAFLVEHFFDLHIGIHNFRLSSTKDSLYGLTVKGGKLKRKLTTRREGRVGQKYWPCAHVHKLLSICWEKVLPQKSEPQSSYFPKESQVLSIHQAV